MDTVAEITITWMDGKVELIREVSEYRLENGVLTIYPPRMRISLPVERTRHLPLANIREIAVDVVDQTRIERQTDS